jgi:hypothetical protein
LFSSDFFSFHEGIWYSSHSTEISYPKDGNEDYFQIEENSFWFRHRNDCIISVIKTYSPNQVFFDIGGGNGIVTKALEINKIQSVLIEPGKQGVINAKSRKCDNIICGSLTDLHGLNGQLQSIGAFDVIEHIEEDIDFINKIHDLLDIGGMLFITVPAYQFLWSIEDTDAGHFRRYSKQKIIKVLEINNFKVIYASYFFSILFLPIFFARTLPSKLNLLFKAKNKSKNEHLQKKGLFGKIINSIWNWELNRIQSNKTIPFGSSCLIVARKY